MYIKIYEKACPICGNDVKGNFKYKYHCERCSILFEYADLKKPTKVVDVITDNIVIKKRIAKKED